MNTASLTVIVHGVQPEDNPEIVILPLLDVGYQSANIGAEFDVMFTPIGVPGNREDQLVYNCAAAELVVVSRDYRRVTSLLPFIRRLRSGGFGGPTMIDLGDRRGLLPLKAALEPLNLDLIVNGGQFALEYNDPVIGPHPNPVLQRWLQVHVTNTAQLANYRGVGQTAGWWGNLSTASRQVALRLIHGYRRFLYGIPAASKSGSGETLLEDLRLFREAGILERIVLFGTVDELIRFAEAVK